MIQDTYSPSESNMRVQSPRKILSFLDTSIESFAGYTTY